MPDLATQASLLNGIKNAFAEEFFILRRELRGLGESSDSQIGVIPFLLRKNSYTKK